jgi:hypothetical protein
MLAKSLRDQSHYLRLIVTVQVAEHLMRDDLELLATVTRRIGERRKHLVTLKQVVPDERDRLAFERVDVPTS